ncbi:MAG TPA: DUF5665 domain-containing protein [Verrucomicrobiae bacterium]|nr:DUF5665 domain-containing protein [Verrucomicrobiae bacterium]
MADEPTKTPVAAPEPSNATVDRLVRAVNMAYSSPGRLMWRGFLYGLMTALGATIGTALFFTILIWFFQRLGGIELLRPGIESIQEIIIPEELRTSTSKDSASVEEFLKKYDATNTR